MRRSAGEVSSLASSLAKHPQPTRRNAAFAVSQATSFPRCEVMSFPSPAVDVQLHAATLAILRPGSHPCGHRSSLCDAEGLLSCRWDCRRDYHFHPRCSAGMAPPAAL